jgi:microcystin-dependent protein
MSDQFVAEIRIFPCNFAPLGWAICQGQLMAISQNTALFSLVGTFYGGNGQSTFGLPNLQGAAPLHATSGPGPGLSTYDVGEVTGVPTQTLSLLQMAAHTHSIMAQVTPASLKAPSSAAVLSRSSGGNAYLAPDGSTGAMAPNMIGNAGTGPVAHNNLMPYLALNFCIALTGIFPPRG